MTKCLPMSGVHLWELSISKVSKNGEGKRQGTHKTEQQGVLQL